MFPRARMEDLGNRRARRARCRARCRAAQARVGGAWIPGAYGPLLGGRPPFSIPPRSGAISNSLWLAGASAPRCRTAPAPGRASLTPFRVRSFRFRRWSMRPPPRGVVARRTGGVERIAEDRVAQFEACARADWWDRPVFGYSRNPLGALSSSLTRRQPVCAGAAVFVGPPCWGALGGPPPPRILPSLNPAEGGKGPDSRPRPHRPLAPDAGEHRPSSSSASRTAAPDAAAHAGVSAKTITPEVSMSSRCTSSASGKAALIRAIRQSGKVLALARHRTTARRGLFLHEGGYALVDMHDVERRVGGRVGERRICGRFGQLAGGSTCKGRPSPCGGLAIGLGLVGSAFQSS